MVVPVDRKYAAFISYSHADKAWADWLHRGFEAYRVPKALVGTEGDAGPVPARVGRVFRDREELGAAHDLGDEIEAALRDSANLVVICSRRAAQSRWVNEELLHWKRLGRTDRVFAIIVDGEPNDPARECFPPALKYEIDADGTLSDRLAEPLAADARNEGDGKPLAKLKLLAGLLGVDFDQLRRREAEAQRRAFRRFVALATVLVLVFAALAAAAGWFAYTSEVQRAEAERQKGQAERNLTAAIDAAGQLSLSIAKDVEDTEGVQQSVLLRIQRLSQELLDKLVQGQNLPPDAEMTYGQSLLKSADAALTTSDPAGALRDAEAALAIFLRLAAADPANAAYQRGQEVSHNLIGDVRFGEGKLDDALRSYGPGLAIAQAQAEAAPSDGRRLSDLWVSHQKIGTVLMAVPDLRRALDSFQHGFKTATDLVALDASNTEYQRDLAVSHSSLGDVAAGQENYDDALHSYQESLAIRQRMAASAPSNAKYQRDLSLIHSKIGELKLGLGDDKAALSSFAAALDIMRRLVASDSANTLYQRDLEVCLDEIGNVKMALKDFAGALKDFQDGRDIAQHLAELDPNNPELQRDLSVSHNEVGDMQFALDKADDALTSYRAGLAIAEALVKADPGNAGYRHDLVASHAKIGNVYESRGDKAAALEHYRQALDGLQALAKQSQDAAQYDADIADMTAAIARVTPGKK